MSTLKKDLKYKNSKQRDRILAILRETKSHPTADWIYDQLKNDFPNVSMGTVYRNLNILVKTHQIQKMAFGSTFDHFDGNQEPHYHFICEKCSIILDVELQNNLDLNKKLESQTQLKVYRHRIDFYGLCEKCAKKINEQ